MSGKQGLDRSDKRLVLVADPRTDRLNRIGMAQDARLEVILAASLGEVYPIAEETAPYAIALSVDFLVDPELETVVRLGDMLGSRVFLYAGAGQTQIQTPIRRRLDCVPMHPGDGIADLLDRLSDPAKHLSPDTGSPRLPEIILIGASTGGIAAIETVLASFPADCPPTLIVQHIREGFVGGLVKRLDGRCRPRVLEAEDGATLSRGAVYFASDGARHLTLGGQHAPRCMLVAGPPLHGHRPAVDRMFDSALPWAPVVAAALLTGMGVDGAAGLGALRRAGAHTIAQNQDSSVVWGMPRAAFEAGAARDMLPLDRIGSSLLSGGSAKMVRT